MDLQRQVFAAGMSEVGVRAAVHSAKALPTDEGTYVGHAATRCERLEEIAHAGQLLLTRAAHDALAAALPSEVTMKDLGLHRLRDLAPPERVYQLCHPDLPGEFPPLRSVDPLRTNLPVQLTSFIGAGEATGSDPHRASSVVAGRPVDAAKEGLQAVETLALEEHDGKTTLRATSVFDSVEDRDGMLAGRMEERPAETSYDRPDEYLEGLKETAAARPQMTSGVHAGADAPGRAGGQRSAPSSAGAG